MTGKNWSEISELKITGNLLLITPHAASDSHSELGRYLTIAMRGRAEYKAFLTGLENFLYGKNVHDNSIISFDLPNAPKYTDDYDMMYQVIQDENCFERAFLCDPYTTQEISNRNVAFVTGRTAMQNEDCPISNLLFFNCRVYARWEEALSLDSCSFENCDIYICGHNLHNCKFSNCNFYLIKNASERNTLSACGFWNCDLADNIEASEIVLRNVTFNNCTGRLSSSMQLEYGVSYHGCPPKQTASEYLAEHFHHIDGVGWIGFRTFESSFKMYHNPASWKLLPGSVLRETCDHNRDQECSYGIHIGSLGWIEQEIPSAKLWAVCVPDLYAPDIVVPYESRGKIRTSYAILCSEIMDNKTLNMFYYHSTGNLPEVNVTLPHPYSGEVALLFLRDKHNTLIPDGYKWRTK